MKQTIFSRVILTSIFAMSLFSTVQAATISIDAPPEVFSGDNFDVNILLDDVTDFAGFEFGLLYDNSVLTAESISSGDVFGVDTFLITSDISTTVVSFAETTLAFIGLDIVNPVLLAVINFTAENIGNGGLQLTDVVLSDSFGFAITPVSILNEDVTVASSTVASPSSLLLMIFAVLAGWRGRSMKR